MRDPFHTSDFSLSIDTKKKNIKRQELGKRKAKQQRENNRDDRCPATISILHEQFLYANEYSKSTV